MPLALPKPNLNSPDPQSIPNSQPNRIVQPRPLRLLIKRFNLVFKDRMREQELSFWKAKKRPG
jgi:hypothetical protein